MKILLILLLISTNALSEALYIGMGSLPVADDGNDGEVYSLMLQDDDCKYSVAYFKEYGRTPWTPRERWPGRIAEKHWTASITKTIYKKEYTKNFNFYVDFGFSYASKLSRVNSTHILFRESFGFEYKDLRLYWRHTSNAGIKGSNTGEDAIILEYSFNL